MSESILKDRSYWSAVYIMNLIRLLQNDHKEYVLTKQKLRSGIAIGALSYEAEFGQSKLDFVHKLSIALKEANESGYWLNLLHDTNCLDQSTFTNLLNRCAELIQILVASIKTIKNKKL